MKKPLISGYSPEGPWRYRQLNITHFTKNSMLAAAAIYFTSAMFLVPLFNFVVARHYDIPYHERPSGNFEFFGIILLWFYVVPLVAGTTLRIIAKITSIPERLYEGESMFSLNASMALMAVIAIVIPPLLALLFLIWVPIAFWSWVISTGVVTYRFSTHYDYDYEYGIST